MTPTCVRHRRRTYHQQQTLKHRRDRKTCICLEFGKARSFRAVIRMRRRLALPKQFPPCPV